MRYVILVPIALSSGVLLAQGVRPDIQVIQPLQFGGLVVNASGGSVVLTANGALSPEGGGFLGVTRPMSAVGMFRLTGPSNGSYLVKVDPAFPVLHGPAGGGVRVVEFLGLPETFQGHFDATGQAEFRLGGRLDMAARTQPGLYTANQVILQLHVAGSSGMETIQRSFSISLLLRAPLVLSSAGPLDFGSLIPGRQPGLFEVFPEGGYRSLGSDGPTLVKGTPKPAAFLLQGPPGSSYSIRLPQNVDLVGPGPAMKVQGFTCDIPLSGILAGPSASFHVGGQLLVKPDQPYGQYRGTFTVEVCYP
jgi:hypothetical protein